MLGTIPIRRRYGAQQPNSRNTLPSLQLIAHRPCALLIGVHRAIGRLGPIKRLKTVGPGPLVIAVRRPGEFVQTVGEPWLRPSHLAGARRANCPALLLTALILHQTAAFTGDHQCACTSLKRCEPGSRRDKLVQQANPLPSRELIARHGTGPGLTGIVSDASNRSQVNINRKSENQVVDDYSWSVTVGQRGIVGCMVELIRRASPPFCSHWSWPNQH